MPIMPCFESPFWNILACALWSSGERESILLEVKGRNRILETTGLPCWRHDSHAVRGQCKSWADSFPLAQADSILSDDFQLSSNPPEWKGTILSTVNRWIQGISVLRDAPGERQCSVVAKHRHQPSSKSRLYHFFSIGSQPWYLTFPWLMKVY